MQQFPDIGGTIDSAFGQYIQRRVQEREAQKQQVLLDTQLQGQYGPGVTMDALAKNPNAFSQAQAANDAGRTEGDSLVARIQSHLRRKAASEALGVRKETAEIAGLEAKANKDKAPEALSLSDRAKIEGQISDDYMKSPTFANFAAAKSGLRDLASIQNNKAGAADIAAIYSFVKTMDNNAVKEGEIQLAQSALPGLDRMKLIVDRLKAGNTLTPQMKREMLVVAKGMYDSKLKTANEFRKTFVERSKQYPGINPDIVAPGFDIPESELAEMMGEGAPVPGAVLKTHKTLGKGWFVPEGNGFRLVKRVP